MDSLLLIEKSSFRRIVICPIARQANSYDYAVEFTPVVANRETACKIDMIPIDQLDMARFESIVSKPIYGSLGLIKLAEGMDCNCFISLT